MDVRIGRTVARTNGPDLKATVEFMGRMVQPEHREVLQGVMEGAELHSTNLSIRREPPPGLKPAV
jgi:hypothetical protein